MYTDVANEVERRPIDAVSVGSVTIPISFAPVTVKVRKPAAAFLGALGGKSRNKNHHRDAIISFYKFAQEKGSLPRGTRPRGRGYDGILRSAPENHHGGQVGETFCDLLF